MYAIRSYYVMLARKIEEKFSKEEILYLYLNQMYFGGGNYGIKAAVRGYFGKDLHELSIAEAALLAGLLAAPGKYSPYVNPEYAKARQKYVLRRMFDVITSYSIHYTKLYDSCDISFKDTFPKKPAFLISLSSFFWKS